MKSKINVFFKFSLLTLAMSLTSMTYAVDSNRPSNLTNNNEVIANRLVQSLKKTGYDQEIISVEKTEVNNIYIVNAKGMPPFFSDSTGRYVMQGQIMELGKGVPIDIMSKHFAKKASVQLSKIPKDEMVIYPSIGERKATVYVFTDVDCPYCTKLHEEIKETNKLGIEVRYLAWPRSERSIPKTKSIWCSEDRVSAMNKAVAGATIKTLDCNSNVVEEHIELGRSLGVSGTPSIFTESGIVIGGYLPPVQLKKAAISN